MSISRRAFSQPIARTRRHAITPECPRCKKSHNQTRTNAAQREGTDVPEYPTDGAGTQPNDKATLDGDTWSGPGGGADSFRTSPELKINRELATVAPGEIKNP